MRTDMCVRCGEGVLNIRVGAIILKDNQLLMVRNDRDGYYYSVGGREAGKIVTRPKTGIFLDLTRAIQYN